MVGIIRSLSLQKALAKRFNEVTCDITHISSLEESLKYPKERADRVKTRFGEAILLSIRDISADRLCKVFLPNVTPPYSGTTMYWPSMTGSPSGIWFRRVDAPIRKRTNWLSSRLVFFTFQVDLSLPKVNTEIPDFLLGDLWTLPEKFKNVSQCMWPANPLGDRPFETEWPNLIHEIKRIGRGVIFRFDYLGGRAYRVPEQYAKAVSDADIRAVNSYKIFYRQEGAGRRFGGRRSGDRVIFFTLSDVAGRVERKTGV